MRPAVGALALAALSLAACSSDSASEDTLPPVGPAATAAATSVAGSVGTTSTVAGPVGSGVVQMNVRLSGISEELLLDRSSVGVDELDPITLDATCTAIDGGEGYSVSIVDVRRLSAGQQLVSATLRVADTAGAVEAGEHEARLELGTAEQDTTRFEGVLVLDAGLASGTFELATGNGATATGSFACGADVASLPTTTTIAPVPATASSPVDVTLADVTGDVATVPAVTTPPIPVATS